MPRLAIHWWLVDDLWPLPSVHRQHRQLISFFSCRGQYNLTISMHHSSNAFEPAGLKMTSHFMLCQVFKMYNHFLFLGFNAWALCTNICARGFTVHNSITTSFPTLTKTIRLDLSAVKHCKIVIYIYIYGIYAKASFSQHLPKSDSNSRVSHSDTSRLFKKRLWAKKAERFGSLQFK